MKPSERLAKHRTRVIEILDAKGLRNPRVFGSVARGSDNAASDLDILIEAPSGTSLFDLAAVELELEGVLGCDVEVTTEGFLAPDIRGRVSGEFVSLL